jgi:hypothetical protein
VATRAECGFERFEIGARPLAYAGAYVAAGDDVWALAFNPAGISFLPGLELGAFYSPQAFGLNELKHVSVVVGFPSSFGSFGAAFRQMGFDLYREASGLVGYGREIGAVHVGASIGYHSVIIQRYGSAGTLAGDVGAVVMPLKHVRVGFAVKNVAGARIGRTGEPLPQTFTLGIAYSPITSFSLIFDYHKEVGFPTSPKFAFEYWILDEVVLRGGAADEPSLLAVGVGIRYSFVQLDYSFTSHQELGFTHQISLTLRWLNIDD